MVGDAHGAEWSEPHRVAAYTSRDTPHRREAEATLLELVATERPLHALDLGTGDGRLLRVLAAHARLATAVGLDSSAEMLARATPEHGNDPEWRFLEHDLSDRLPPVGPVDIVVSGLAIHHLPDRRKRALTEEVFALLAPGGVFINFDLVRLPTPRLQQAFLSAIGRADGDPSDQPSPLADQLRWLRDAGFDDADCFWKWRGMVVIAGRVPDGEASR